VDVLGIVSECIDSVFLGEVDGSLVVKPLGDDDESIDPKYLFRSNHRVEGSETGKVAVDLFRGNSSSDQRLLHGFGFVVGVPTVVSADEKGSAPPVVIELQRGGDAVAEVEVFSAVAEIFAAA